MKDLLGTRQSLIARATNATCRNFSGTFQNLGIDRREVEQQAWVEWLRLERQHPTNPGKYLGRRMIDWIRRITAYNHYAKEKRKFVHTQLELMEGPRVDEDRIDIIRRTYSIALNLSARHFLVIDMFLAGYHLKEIGVALGVVESRACQLYREIVRECQRTFCKGDL